VCSIVCFRNAPAWRAWNNRAVDVAFTQMNTSPPLENVTVCHITIGREREIERLGRLMEQLQAGQGTTVLITGEAGISKSRLVGEALDGCGTTGGYAGSRQSCATPVDCARSRVDRSAFV
jgi:hypothetical protein